VLTRTHIIITCTAAAAAVGLAAGIAAPALATAQPAPSGVAGPGGTLRLTHHAFGPSTAAPTSNRDFAGYQTGVTAGSATSAAATFTVPKLSCTTAGRVIAADAGVAANKFKTASIAGVAIGCAKGRAVYFPSLVANGAEADYTSTHLSAGDVINLSASVTTSGTTVQVTDVTKNVTVATTITGAGASANAAWIGDDSWYSNSGTRLGVPNFGKLTFTNCLIDATALGGWHPQAYQRVNGHGTVEIATGGFWPGGTAFNTLYRNS
jgi:peptidase A4-like protein